MGFNIVIADFMYWHFVIDILSLWHGCRTSLLASSKMYEIGSNPVGCNEKPRLKKNHCLVACRLFSEHCLVWSILWPITGVYGTYCEG